MKKNKLNTLIFALGVISISIGLAGCNQDEEPALPKDNGDSEGIVEQASVVEGEKVAKTSCISCHGVDLTGDMGPSLRNLSLTKDEIITVLIKGQKSMPPATAKGHEEDVAAYLLTLK